MQDKLIGREQEKTVLLKTLQSNRAEMVSVIDRRRIGKTFLMQMAYKDHIAFEMTGIQHAPRTEQLQNFAIQFSKHSKSSLPILPTTN